MTIATELVEVTRSWTGVETLFSTGIPALEADHVRVTAVAPDGARLVLTRGVHFDSRLAGGLLEVLPLAMPPAPQTLFIRRRTPALHLTNYNTGAFDPAVLERTLDGDAMRDAEIRHVADRALTVPSGEAGMALPPVADRANRLLAFDASGALNPVEPSLASNGTVLAASIVDASAAGRALLTAANAAAQRDLLGIDRSYNTRADVASATIPPDAAAVMVHGYAAAGDGGGGVYVRLGSAPVPVKAWHLQSADGAWWELRAFPIYPRQLGALLDGGTGDATALQAWLDYAGTLKVPAHGQSGAARLVSATLNVPAGVQIDGLNLLKIVRSGDTHQPLMLASGVAAPAIRGMLFDYEAGTTSASTVTMALGAATFTVGAGRGFVAGQFVVIRPTASPGVYMIAQVTSYSGATLVVNVTTNTGSGAFSAWHIMTYTASSGSGFTPAALRVVGCADAVIERNTIQGKFFIGIGLQNCDRPQASDNTIQGVSDRAIEWNATAGGTAGSVISNNLIDGAGWTFYGINCSSTVGAHSDMVIEGNTVTGVLAQGISINGNLPRVVVDNNAIRLSAAAAGVGVLIQRLGTAIPTGAIVSNNTITLGSHGVYLLDVYDFVVNANSIELAGANGVFVQSIGANVAGYSGLITSNNVRNCTGDGISLTASVAGNLGHVLVSVNVTKANGGVGLRASANTVNCTLGPNNHYGNTGGATSIAGTGHTII